MKTKTYSVYTFAELSADAKQRAKDKHAALFGFSWSDDYLASLKALAEHFGGKLSDFQIDWFNGSYSSASFEMPDDDLASLGEDAEEVERSIAAKLAELGAFNPETLKGLGDCKLTGFCGDESAIDGFRIAWHGGERDLSKLMQSAFRAWLDDAQADCAGQYEDDTFAEYCEANGYEFTEEGRID